jgi:hypothetical protein
MIGGHRVVEFKNFHFSCLLKWKFHFSCWGEMKTPFQPRAEMDSISWNENSDFLRDQHLGKRWIYGHASRPIHHTNTIQIHGIRAGQAGRAGSRTHRHARHPAEMEIASWNGIFISAQQLKWIFHFSKKSIKLLVARRDHFLFHLRASAEPPNRCHQRILSYYAV